MTVLGYYDVNEPIRIKMKLKANGFEETVMEIGDYFVDDIVIERTTYGDLLKKLDEKRYNTQLMNLKHNVPDNLKTLWIVEGDLKRAFMTQFGMKWGHDNRRRKRILGAISSIYKHHGISMLPSVDSESTARLIIGLAEKQYEKGFFDLRQTMESPVRGLGSVKFSEIVSWFSILGKIPFTHMTNKQIIKTCIWILETKKGQANLKHMKGVGKKTIKKLKEYYERLEANA